MENCIFPFCIISSGMQHGIHQPASAFGIRHVRKINKINFIKQNNLTVTLIPWLHFRYFSVGLPLDEVLLPQRLKSLGYNTHMVGKWHLGHHTKAFLPNSRGFDSFYGYYSGAIGFYDHFIQHPVSFNGIKILSGSRRKNNW